MFYCIDNLHVLCFVEFIDSLSVEYFYLREIFSQLKGMGQLGPLPWKVMGHILKSWDNDPVPP